MSLREAASQALEWMNTRELNVEEWVRKGREAREALRAALAEGDNAVEIVELRAALTDLKAWKAAVHDALVINWAFTAEHENDPRKAVADLIAAEVRIALDPLVSSEAQALIDRGKAEPAGAESVVNQQLTTELSDEEILAILKSVDPRTVRLPPGIAAFARAVLAAARGKG